MNIYTRIYTHIYIYQPTHLRRHPRDLRRQFPRWGQDQQLDVVLLRVHPAEEGEEVRQGLACFVCGGLILRLDERINYLLYIYVYIFFKTCAVQCDWNGWILW